MLASRPTRGSGALESTRLAAIPGLVHGFTTRIAGTVAAREGASGHDAVDSSVEGRWLRRGLTQVHGSRVVDAGQLGLAAPCADGLVTTWAGTLLVIRTADCLPILLAAVDGGRPVAVAALHAGWRGLVAGIIPEGLRALRATARDAALVACIGPSIGACCFEIGPEVAAPLEALAPGCTSPGRGDRSMADLPLAARVVLASLGVGVADSAPPCTRCDPERFHSYRAAGSSAGRMGAFIGMTE